MSAFQPNLRHLALDRVAILIAEDFAAADMVCRADQPLTFHPLDPFGGGVVAHAHLALEP